MAGLVVDIDVRGWHWTPRIDQESLRWWEDQHGTVGASFTVLDEVVLDRLAEDCPVVISDTDGTVLWTGQVAGDGLQAGADGIGMDVTCVGEVERLNAAPWRLPYLVSDLGEWERSTIKYFSHPNVQLSTGARPEDPPWESLLFRVPKGGNIYPNQEGRMAYLGHLGTDMHVGAIRFWADAGTSSPDWRYRLEIGDQFWGNVPINKAWDSAAVLEERRAGLHWTAPLQPITPAYGSLDNYVVISVRYIGTTGLTNEYESIWFAASNIRVAGQLVDVRGENVPTSSDGPFPQEVVRDLVGRCLVGIVDPDLVSTAYLAERLDTLDYRDGATPAQVLTDLEEIHTGHMWRVGPRDRVTGLSSLTFTAWQSEPRYVIPADSEIDLSGVDRPLANEVDVTWRDWKGRPRSSRHRASPTYYPDISPLQQVRREVVDIGEGTTATATVERIGLAALDEVARRRLAGKATVTSPVHDLWTGQVVPAHHMQAGCLAITPDGEATLRITAVDKTPGRAEVTLGQPYRTTDQIVAARGRRARRR